VCVPDPAGVYKVTAAAAMCVLCGKSPTVRINTSRHSRCGLWLPMHAPADGRQTTTMQATAASRAHPAVIGRPPAGHGPLGATAAEDISRTACSLKQSWK
jgi:hypothetical protein